MLQDTNYYSYCNQGTIVCAEGRGGYRYKTIHFYSHNQGECDRLLTSPGYTVCGDGRVCYSSQTRHSSSQKGYIKDAVARHGIRS